MNTLTVAVEDRSQLGTRASKRLRKEGLIPSILTAKEQEAKIVSVHEKELIKSIDQGLRIIDISYNGTSHKAFIKEVQFDHLGDKIYHVDLHQVQDDESITLSVPLVLVGKPIGVIEEGGRLRQYHRDLEISCLPGNVPMELRGDVTPLRLMDGLKVKDLQVGEGISILRDPSWVVAAVTSRTAKKRDGGEEGTGDGEAPTEPEVISESKSDATDVEKKD